MSTAWLTMADGLRLSVTFFKPVPKSPVERFPVLFDYYPYRKDEDPTSYSLYTYFARRGYITATVDVRGTGSSEGAVPDREYSERELADGLEVIRQLAERPESNGRVGMWGKSWGGFNAIQTAMRRPPALKAILAIDATDDLYADDVHHMDGAFHCDEFMSYMDNENILPRTPDLRLDEEYFRDRFDHDPWFLTYAKEQVDGEFWRRNSLRWQYDTIAVPCYLIGGLLDGYRDSLPRMLENMKVPVRAVLGPWKHDWPDTGVPGPNYEWRHEAVRWWDRWLKDKDTGVLEDPRFIYFLRAGHAPDPGLKTTTGRWVGGDWPPAGLTWRRLYPTSERRLEDRPGSSGEAGLKYVPSCGVATGFWWGEPTGDLRSDDAGSLVFDSPPLREPLEIAGFPAIRLRVSVDAPTAHWVARLEDVQPDGTVSLVTGKLINGSQRRSRLRPEPLVPGEEFDLAFELHFTTWTFQPGHRIRLAVSNAQWPMIWPTPYPMTSRLALGDERTRLDLPLVPAGLPTVATFLPPEPQEDRSDARYLGGEAWPGGGAEWTKDLLTSKTSMEWRGSGDFEIGGRRFHTEERTVYVASDADPARALFSGEASWRAEEAGRTISIRSRIDVTSDRGRFRVTVTRSVEENGRLLRRREWKETVPRCFN
jgi:putative CocE/NonD family hydrolase